MGLFTPDMAFEAIVKRRIEMLLHPALGCVDMVSTELGAVVQKCADGVSESVQKLQAWMRVTFFWFESASDTLK